MRWRRFHRDVVAFRTPARDIWAFATNNCAETAMPEGQEAVAWDFLTFVTGWNLIALPALLLFTSAFILIKNRTLRTADPPSATFDGRRVVRIVALIHLGLGLHGVIRLVQELLTMRVMGVTESFANFIVESLAVIVNPLLALGFWLARPMARFSAMAWYLFLSVIAVLVVLWYRRYHVPVQPVTWPNHLCSKVMPLFLLVTMSVPRVKRVFVRQKPGSRSPDEFDTSDLAAGRNLRWSVVSLVALLFLIVVASNLVVDSADWIERSVAEWNQSQES
jgi:hypothetical protein